MKNHVCMTGLAAVLAACTVPVSPEAVLVPDAEHRRTGFDALEMADESALRAGAVLRHAWAESDIGPIAMTWAQRDAQAPADRLTVVCMGNATDRRSDGVAYLNGVLPFGDAMTFDYPGYGDSAGPASLESFETALSAIGRHIDASSYETVVLWGHSMGGFLCPRLADRLQEGADAVVFEATYNDASALSRYAVPWYLAPFVRLEIDERFLAYDSARTLEGFEGRAIVLAAAKDRDLPILAQRDLARRLELANLDMRYVEFEEAGHHDIKAQPDFEARVRAAFDEE
ncbi:MAG: alpha/beta hydrolase [Oceanicaulis sp.]